MQNANGWLVLHDGDTLNIVINLASIEKVIKHYVEGEGRSYFCYGDDCIFCHDGIPRRIRYIADITYRGETLKWEVGEILYRVIRRLPADQGLARATVTRSGKGKHTRYQVRSPNERRRSSRVNQYDSSPYRLMAQS